MVGFGPREELSHPGGARRRDAALRRREEPNEVGRASDQDASGTQVFWTRPSGRRPRGRPRTDWRDYLSRLAREGPGLPQQERLRRSSLLPLPPNLGEVKQRKKFTVNVWFLLEGKTSQQHFPTASDEGNK